MPDQALPPVVAVSKRPWRLVVSGLLVVATIWGGYFFFWRHHVKRFMALREGVFYRVAQPTEFGMRHLIEDHKIKTILSVQLHDFRLSRGLYDLGEPDGMKESECVAGLGGQYVQWPMGEEACWPWLTPWQFEEFFKLIDDPANLPVAVHCMGGRHRTGTLSALFRLEYDRWPADKVLEEMYSFRFGPAISVHEHNLRTYLPRPLPSEAEWSALKADFGKLPAVKACQDYAELVRVLRGCKQQPAVQAALAEYLASDRPFALALAQRMVDKPDEPLASEAAVAAFHQLQKPADSSAAGSSSEWSMAAALVADFGQPEHQQLLLELLTSGSQEPQVSPRYQALVAGVTNRYTANRLAFLRPLFDDSRQRPEPAARAFRFCDTAVARWGAIIDLNPVRFARPQDVPQWDAACQLAREWYEQHPSESALTQLTPPTGQTVVRAGDGPLEEDLHLTR